MVSQQQRVNGVAKPSDESVEATTDDDSSSATTTTDAATAYTKEHKVFHPTLPTRVQYVAETKLPTDIGDFQLRAYRVPGAPLGQEPCVIYNPQTSPIGSKQAVPVRIHDQCLTSEVFRSQRYVVVVERESAHEVAIKPQRIQRCIS